MPKTKWDGAEEPIVKNNSIVETRLYSLDNFQMSFLSIVEAFGHTPRIQF